MKGNVMNPTYWDVAEGALKFLTKNVDARLSYQAVDLTAEALLLKCKKHYDYKKLVRLRKKTQAIQDEIEIKMFELELEKL